MLVITQDWILTDETVLEHACCDAFEIMAETAATCALAKQMIERGVDPQAHVTLLRADPWLFPSPHKICSVTLLTVSKINLFGECPENLFESMQSLARPIRYPNRLS